MDGDAFFVAVEIAKNPKLKGKAVVTGEEKGIVTALSYEAKALGVTRGLPVFQLKKLFPKVIILPGDYRSYAIYSQKMFDIVRRYADDVEEYSIDECFADLTGLDKPLKMSYRQIAERIQKEIMDELSVSVSIGIAPTKVLAKVASKWKKPFGITVIEKEGIEDFLKNTTIGKIWGIGRQTTNFMHKMNIDTGYDFISKNVSWIREHLARPYETLWQELKGDSLLAIDPKPKTDYSSIQKTRSFHPATNDSIFLLSRLSKNIEEACAKARHYKLIPKKLSFFLKTRNFEYHRCVIPLSAPTNAPELLLKLIEEQFNTIYQKGVLYRTTGVTLFELVPSSASQSDLFGGTDRAHKFEAIHNQIDSLENKFGKKVVYLASTHRALKAKEKGTDADDLDRDLLFL
jgi:DNA polymerase-4/DNA polymerase V